MPTPSAVNYSEQNAIQHRLAQEGLSTGGGLDAGSGQQIIAMLYSGGANFTATNGTIQTNSITSPAGTLAAADTFTDNGATGQHLVTMTTPVVLPNNTWVRFVAFLKASPAFTTVSIGMGTNAGVVFDVLSGLVISTNIPASPGNLQQDPMISGGLICVTPSTLSAPVNVVNPTNDWYRCVVQLFCNNVSLGQATGATVSVAWNIAANAGRSYTGATNIAFSVAAPPRGVPTNFSEQIALQNVTLLRGRNTV